MTDALEQFNDQQEAEKVCRIVQERLVKEGFDEAEITQNLHVMASFANIATGHMIRGRGGIPVPGAPDQVIPYDLRMAQQTMNLFMEGMYHSFIKCRELKITHDKTLTDPQSGQSTSIKGYFLQATAMEIFNQVDNLVASTLGQDALPEFKISEEQQLALIHQTVEGDLLYRVTEYEKIYGPISPEDNMDLLSSASTVSSSSEAAPQPVSAPMPVPVTPQPVSSVPAAPAPVKKPAVQLTGPSPHDKYAAVSLLLQTLPDKRRDKILSQFNAEEKELITFYGDATKIEGNLDLASVENHLKRFSEQLASSGKPSLKSKASDGIRELCQGIDPDVIESSVTTERPLVKKYIGDVLGDIHPERPVPVSAAGDYLPALTPKMEEIVYRYMHKQFKDYPRTEAPLVR